MFMALDCLYAAGRDLRELALRARREWLEDMSHGSDLVLPAGRLADDCWLKAWQQSPRARLREPGSEGPGVALRRWAHAEVAQGEAAPLPHERGWEPKRS
jgi:hypothetical protein